MESKQNIREAMRRKRRLLPKSAQRKHAAALTHRLLLIKQITAAHNIAGYFPTDGEINVRPFMQKMLSDGKQLYVPVLKDESMCFAQITEATKTHKNRFNIEEPRDIQECVNATQLDVIIVPVVAFDDQKNRLGRSWGFYDRLLQEADDSTTTIGVAYEFQLVSSLPVEQHDIALDLIVTNNQVHA